MAQLIIGNDHTTLRETDPDTLALMAVHAARKRGVRAALADDRGRKVPIVLPAGPLGPACGREDAT